MGNIILISDVYELRKKKEDELRFYNEELEKLKNKLFFIQKEIDVTNFIIDIIERETVVDIKQLVQDKKDSE